MTTQRMPDIAPWLKMTEKECIKSERLNPRSPPNTIVPMQNVNHFLVFYVFEPNFFCSGITLLFSFFKINCLWFLHWNTTKEHISYFCIFLVWLYVFNIVLEACQCSAVFFNVHIWCCFCCKWCKCKTILFHFVSFNQSNFFRCSWWFSVDVKRI